MCRAYSRCRQGSRTKSTRACSTRTTGSNSKPSRSVRVLRGCREGDSQGSLFEQMTWDLRSNDQRERSMGGSGSRVFFRTTRPEGRCFRGSSEGMRPEGTVGPAPAAGVGNKSPCGMCSIRGSIRLLSVFMLLSANQEGRLFVFPI